MSFSFLLKICHSIENFYSKFERLFLVGKVSKKIFVAPKFIYKFQILSGLMGKVKEKS